jgi:hypothetical protein
LAITIHHCGGLKHLIGYAHFLINLKQALHACVMFLNQSIPLEENQKNEMPTNCRTRPTESSGRAPSTNDHWAFLPIAIGMANENSPESIRGALKMNI